MQIRLEPVKHQMNLQPCRKSYN